MRLRLLYNSAMHILLFFLLVFWVSVCFAETEIAIEGEHGWADQLPTWRLSKEHILSRLLSGGRELTGYHLWVQTFLFSVLHIAYLFTAFSWKVELQLFSFILFVWIVEDFLWFVLNPAFGVKKFKKEYIWWHERTWWWFAPRDYFLFIPTAIVLLIISQYI